MKNRFFWAQVLLGVRGWLSETAAGQTGQWKRRIGVWLLMLLWGALMSGGVASGQVFSLSIPSGQPVLTDAEDMAVDGGSNIYVVQRAVCQVVKLSPTGSELWRIGTCGTGLGQFTDPFGVAVDSASNIYVVEFFRGDRVQKFDAHGKFLLTFGTEGTGNGQFDIPSGVAVDSASNIYMADTGNNRIQKFDAQGTSPSSRGHQREQSGMGWADAVGGKGRLIFLYAF